MRVIAGKLGGRIFASPRGRRTHPMSEKVRGALFAMLGDIEGLTVLDAFSGSGALSYEAISRGASQVTAVEVSVKARKIIKENIESLGIEDQMKIIRANITGWSARNDHLFDIILLDPPYDYLQTEALQKLTKHLGAGGTLVLSWPGREKALKMLGLTVVQSRKYGDATLHFYKHR